MVPYLVLSVSARAPPANRVIVLQWELCPFLTQNPQISPDLSQNKHQRPCKSSGTFLPAPICCSSLPSSTPAFLLGMLPPGAFVLPFSLPRTFSFMTLLPHPPFRLCSVESFGLSHHPKSSSLGTLHPLPSFHFFLLHCHLLPTYAICFLKHCLLPVSPN